MRERLDVLTVRGSFRVLSELSSNRDGDGLNARDTLAMSESALDDLALNTVLLGDAARPSVERESRFLAVSEGDAVVSEDDAAVRSTGYAQP